MFITYQLTYAKQISSNDCGKKRLKVVAFDLTSLGSFYIPIKYEKCFTVFALAIFTSVKIRLVNKFYFVIFSSDRLKSFNCKIAFRKLHVINFLRSPCCFFRDVAKKSAVELSTFPGTRLDLVVFNNSIRSVFMLFQKQVNIICIFYPENIQI